MQRGHPRTITTRRVVAAAELDAEVAARCSPRHDIVAETREPADPPVDAADVFGGAPADDGRPAAAPATRATFGLETGPFHEYRREVLVEPQVDGSATLTETITFDLAVPMWGLLFRRPIARTLQRPPRAGSAPWWAPPARLDARASTVLALLCTVSLVCGYLGTVITQTITFAAEEFGKDKGAQGNTLAAVRVGVFVSMAIVTLADRRGRRAFTAWGAIVAAVFTVLGAFSVDLWTLGATQTVARGITTAVAILVTIVAAEELPAGARAYGLSVLTLVAGLGAGMAVWVLPVADLDVRAWRVVYLVPILAIALLVPVVRGLPETQRFEVARTTGGARMSRSRLVVLALSAFFILAFRTPASQLQNEFLRDERGYSAADITLFTIVTSTPVGLGVFIGGRLADERGRRVVAAVALVAGSAFVVVSFLTHGWPMWAWQLVGIVIGAATIPALGVYGPELFGTRSRGTANGLVSVAGVAGSTLGLLLASHLSDEIGLGKALAMLSVGPVIVAALVLAFYPETAHLELEQISPDAPPVSRGDPPTTTR